MSSTRRKLRRQKELIAAGRKVQQIEVSKQTLEQTLDMAMGKIKELEQKLSVCQSELDERLSDIDDLEARLKVRDIDAEAQLKAKGDELLKQSSIIIDLRGALATSRSVEKETRKELDSLTIKHMELQQRDRDAQKLRRRLHEKTTKLQETATELHRVKRAQSEL